MSHYSEVGLRFRDETVERKREKGTKEKDLIHFKIPDLIGGNSCFVNMIGSCSLFFVSRKYRFSAENN